METLMRAAVWYGHRDIRIEERPVPEPLPGHVIVRVAWAGICGTDRHEYTGPNFIPVTKPHRLTGKMAPLILGHEFAGTIAALGSGVSGWEPGGRVTANGTLACGECEACRAGRYNICEKLGFVGVSRDGAFAGYVSIEAARLFRVPDSLSLHDAVLAEPLACGIHAVRLLAGGDGPSGGRLDGKKVLVAGPGIIGISCFFAALEAGAASVIVAGLGEARRSLVEGSGGIYVDSDREDLASVLHARFGGLADIAFECVGVQGSLDTAMRLLKPGGALMVMGVFEKPPAFGMNGFQEGERRLFTSQAHVDEIAAALERLAGKRPEAARLVTGEVTLDSLVSGGFEELLARPDHHIKVLIRIGGES